MTDLTNELIYREKQVATSTRALLRKVIDDIDSDTLEPQLCEAAIVSLAALELAKSASAGARRLDNHVTRGNIGCA